MQQNLESIIRYHRKRAGLTQMELSQMAGISKASVWDIENGKETFQWNTLLSLLRVLNIEMVAKSPLMNEYEAECDEKS